MQRANIPDPKLAEIEDSGAPPPGENDGARIRLKAPYLIFIGNADNALIAKTGFGLVHWCPERVVGQLRLKGARIDLGVPSLSIDEAVRAGARSLVIGVAPVGGAIADDWVGAIIAAADAGMDIVSGMHGDLNDIAGLSEVAERSGASLINIRTPPRNIPVGTGQRRTGRRLLTVGTDCGVGKKYTALAMTSALKGRGHKATFRATGQTGIMISGAGLPIDAVVVDFVSGAAEMLSPDNDPDHWDVIEGQGSLLNASYSGVSLGLLHGSQPDAIIVCHDPRREQVSTCPGMPMPAIAEVIDLNLRMGRLTNPDIRCVAVALNTSLIGSEERDAYLRQMSDELGVMCLDPLIDGCDAIVDSLESDS